MKKLLLTGLLAALAVPATMSAMDDALTLTFNVTGTSINDVSVTVEGVDGVTATLNSIEQGNQSLGTQQIKNFANYLCPSANSKDATEASPLTFNFTISGVPSNYSVENINLTTAACTGSAGLQGTENDRPFVTTVSVDNNTINFGEIDIAINNSSGLKSWLEELSPAINVSGNVNLTVTAYAVGNATKGCFFGLESITFNSAKMDISEVIGNYNGAFYNYDGDEDSVRDVRIVQGKSDTSVFIYNLFQAGEEYPIPGVFDGAKHTITISAQYLGDDYLYAFTDWYDEEGTGSVYLTIGDDGKLTLNPDQGLELYVDSTEEYLWMDYLILTPSNNSSYPSLEQLLGHYTGYYLTRDGEKDYTFTDVTILYGENDNEVVISGIMRAGGDVVATYDQTTGMLTVAGQTLKDGYTLWCYANGANAGNFTIPVLSTNKIAFPTSYILEPYNYNTSTVYYEYGLNLTFTKALANGEYNGRGPAVGKSFEYNGIQYTITSMQDGNYTCATAEASNGSYSPNGSLTGEVVIPTNAVYSDKFGYTATFTVTSIGQFSFANSPLTAVTIPASVTKINYCAFIYCTDIQTVTNFATTPQSLSEYDYAFYQVPCETDVLFVPESAIEAYRKSNVWKDFGRIRAIGQDANTPMAGDYFLDNGIYYRIIDATANTVMTKEGSYFSQGGYWEGQNVEGENLVIPEKVYYQGETFTVVEIGDGSFAYCNDGEGLKSIVIPDTVETIGEGAFSENYNVTSISFGSGLKTIGADAFYSFDSLEEVSITAQTPPVADEDAFFSTDIEAVTLTVPVGTGEKYAEAEVWKDFNIQANVKVSFSETEHMIESVTLDEVEMTNWSSGFTATTGQVLEITFETYPEGYEPKVIVNNKNVSDEVIDGVWAIVVGYDNINFSATWVEEGTTGINSIESVDGIEAIYNLNGVRVSKDRLTKGLYIINGQKVLVK